MTRRSLLQTLPAALMVLAACYAAPSERQPPPQPDPDVEWTHRVTLQLRQRASFDRGALEISLRETGLSEALIYIGGVAARQELLHVGSGGGARVGQYDIELVSTGISGSATLEISKRR
ncbi:MAG: hypothetical protein ABR559_07450 [Gemmatimonadota bacterium]